jgi:hypothetical protein
MPNPIPDGNLPTQWWAVIVARFGSQPVYSYMKGTYADAKRKSERSLATGNNLISGPFPTKKDAKTSVRLNQSNPPFSL